MLEPVLARKYKISLEPGSLNLWVDADVVWREPLEIFAGDRDWQLCPIIIEEKAIGLAFRANTGAPRLLEVLSPVHLRTRLGDVKDGDRIYVRLLAGTDLGALSNERCS